MQIEQTPLHLLYRPENLDEVIGQRAARVSLSATLDKGVSGGSPHAYLFTGPSGVGKTTMARILARAFNCSRHNIREYDAATYSGADDIRELCDSLNYKGFGSTPNVCVILDECHALSKQAWQVVLKSLEEPPVHVYWCLCTTEKEKVPKSIVTRCATYDLKLLNLMELEELIDAVCEDQSINLSTEIKTLIAERSEGSARQALVLLGQVRGLEDVELAKELLEEPDQIPIGPLQLCQVISRPDFKLRDAYAKIKSMRNEDPEYVRICVRGYFTACCLNEAKEDKLHYFSRVLGAFSGGPYVSRERMAPVLDAVWKCKES